MMLTVTSTFLGAIMIIKCLFRSILSADDKINPANKQAYQVTCHCSEEVRRRMKYKWYFYHSDDRINWKEVESFPSMVTTPLTSTRLAVKANVISGGGWYKFLVRGGMPGDSEGFSGMVKQVNLPPKMGTCKASPPEGIWKDTFTVWCSGFEDEDSPLVFCFTAGSMSICQSDTYRRFSSLPPGDENNDFNMTISVRVSDRLGASVTQDVLLKVCRTLIPACHNMTPSCILAHSSVQFLH